MSESPSVPLQRRQELERLLRTNPLNLDAFLELAAIYRRENRPVEARRILGQALEVFPGNVDLLFQHEEAILARSLQQYREVADLAARLQTSEADRELSRATTDWAMRRIEVCRARLQRDASALQLNIQLAEAHLDAEDYEEAIEVAGRMTKHDAYAAPAHLILGRCALAAGDDLTAMKYLRAAALRRAVTAPPAIRCIALRLLCDAAAKLGVTETLEDYRSALITAEADLAAQQTATPPTSTPPTSTPPAATPPTAPSPQPSAP